MQKWGYALFPCAFKATALRCLMNGSGRRLECCESPWRRWRPAWETLKSGGRDTPWADLRREARQSVLLDLNQRSACGCSLHRPHNRTSPIGRVGACSPLVMRRSGRSAGQSRCTRPLLTSVSCSQSVQPSRFCVVRSDCIERCGSTTAITSRLGAGAGSSGPCWSWACC